MTSAQPGTEAQSVARPALPAALDPARARVLIVGAGAFGLSTAHHLLEDGFGAVRVLDRARSLPALDAASTDMNKIVRSCYTDAFYTRLAREAIVAWTHPMWQGCYHPCGVLNVGDAPVERAYHNDVAAGASVCPLPTPEAIRATFPPPTSTGARAPVGPFTGYTGYLGHAGGWAEAARALQILLDAVVARGASVEPGKHVVALVRSSRLRTIGVRCADGSTYLADRVVLATGAWTASTFPQLQLDARCLATGQTLAMIQLDAHEAEWYARCPVVLDSRTGFYVLPPNRDNIVKLAVHSAGHTHMVVPEYTCSRSGHTSAHRKISTPRTILSHPEGSDGLRVPRSALRTIRNHLRAVYPELAQKPWADTRLCWYTSSPDEDWVIGGVPGDPGLFLATSGSGHAFKFLPNVGRLVVDILQGTADAETTAKFAVDRQIRQLDDAEQADGDMAARDLVLDELRGPKDVLPDDAHGEEM